MILWLAAILSFFVGKLIDLPEPGLVFSVIFILIALSCQAGFWLGEAEDIERIVMTLQDKEIYKKQADELLAEFSILLAEKYPNFEKEIFENMKPEKVTAYMIKYPELKSSQTICKLVDLINSKKEKIYDCDLKITGYQKDRRLRRRIQFFWC